MKPLAGYLWPPALKFSPQAKGIVIYFALMEAEKYTLFTVEDYLEAEDGAEIRHEYLNGTIHAMSGASRRHNTISLRIARALDRQVGPDPCRTYMSEVKVRVRTMAGDFFYYPDVMVGCDPTDKHDYYLERPSILFEVTSPSTAAKDRREKLLAYQSLPSLEHYVIVSQERPSIEWFRRSDEGWDRIILSTSDDRMAFPSIGVSLTLGEIYEGIDSA